MLSASLGCCFYSSRVIIIAENPGARSSVTKLLLRLLIVKLREGAMHRVLTKHKKPTQYRVSPRFIFRNTVVVFCKSWFWHVSLERWENWIEQFVKLRFIAACVLLLRSIAYIKFYSSPLFQWLLETRSQRSSSLTQGSRATGILISSNRACASTR